jgi:hypothetical protein
MISFRGGSNLSSCDSLLGGRKSFSGNFTLNLIISRPFSNMSRFIGMPSFITHFISLFLITKEIIIPDDAEEHDLVEFNPHERRRHQYKQAHDEDEDGMGPHGQRVQCASQ